MSSRRRNRLEGSHWSRAGGAGLAGLFLLLGPGPVFATQLIADLNVLGKASEFDGFEDDAVVFDDRYYIFGGDEPILGREPWVLDTDTGVAEPLADLAPGSASSNPREFVAIDSGVVFVATTPDLGTELWFTDGTPAGTQLLLDIKPGPESSFPAGLYSATGARVLFRADDGVNGFELWRTNGTPAGTVLIDDINPGAASSSPSDFVLYNGQVYFRASDATNGAELWRVSSTGVTGLVLDIEPGPTSGNPTGLAVIDTSPTPYLAFRACRAPEGCEVWRSDGSAGGTQLLVDIHPSGSSTPANFVWHPGLGRMFFSADDGSFGNELWQFVPGSGASRVSDVLAGSTGSFPKGFGVLPSRLVFTTPGATGSGTRLYSYDGATVSFLVTVSTAGVPNNPEHTVTWGTQVYFYEGSGCWRTDGTAGGTIKWASCRSDSTFAIGAGALFYADSISSDTELWSIDQSNAVSQRTNLLSFSSDPAEPTWLGEGVLFVADSGVGGREPWWWDGTNNPPTQLDLNPGTPSSSPRDLVAFDGHVWFGASSAATGYELWSTDGTQVGTSVYDLQPGTSGGLDVEPVVAGGKLYFSAYDETIGYYLARFDGHGSSPVVISAEGETGIGPEYLVPFGDRLYFTAWTSGTGYEWFSVGSTEVVATSHEVVPGVGEPGDIEIGVGWDGWFYFLADDGSGLQIWRTSGTTVEVVTGFADMSTGYTYELEAGPGGVYFVHDDDPTGAELWRTDGTTTTLVADIDPGDDSSYPGSMTAAGDFLYFEASAPDSGYELYRTTGTGAELVADLRPGEDSSSPGQLKAVGDRVVFVADDGVSGKELWITREAGGVSRLPEAWIGSGGSDPDHLSVAPDGSRVVFSGVTLATAREPFVVDIELFADGFESGNTAAWSATVP